MPFSITCSACNKRLKAKDSLAGKLVPCPYCGQKVSIPEAEDDAAAYLLSEESPPAQTPAQVRPARNEQKPEQNELRRLQQQAKPVASRVAATLPPLTTNDPPLWLRHLHWSLMLALIPLAFSTLQKRDSEEDFAHRLAETLEKTPLEARARIISVLQRLDEGKGSVDDLFAALPDHKLAGAFLPRSSWMHWAFAAGSATLFFTFLLLLGSQGTAEPVQLLTRGLFTATIGILLLLLVQVIADWSSGVILTGRSVLVIIFYIVKFIGFSYRAALDPENGFFLSFLGFTLGVGLCEEVCKLLPLLWHYRQPSRQTWRTAFLWGLASGTGFGISEGITYSSGFYNGISGPGIYVVRFISCVALHALWTGSAAITLHQRQGLIQESLPWYEYIPRVVLIVGIPMLLHGLYDTLLKKEFAALALVVALASFGFLAFQISRLGSEDDTTAKEAMLRDYQKQRMATR